jgi:NAD(P)H-dependent flavin oxidoreductase YrpB (nitropropane dioxygenase family)
VVDLEQIGKLGLPFWVAGSAGRPERLKEALAAGAAGIQVGTLFAYADESGLTDEIRRAVLDSVLRGTIRIRTEARASPTGFPFKLVSYDGDPAEGVVRKRICDLGYLRTAYGRGEKGLGYRCASEPEEQFVAKGGAPEELPGRQCLCNALLSTIGLGQLRDEGLIEPPLLTSGDEVVLLSAFLDGRTHYTAADAVRYLLGGARA